MDVVKGAEGDFFVGLVSKLSTVKSAPSHFFRNARASSNVLNFEVNSAFTVAFPVIKFAVTL